MDAKFSFNICTSLQQVNSACKVDLVKTHQTFEVKAYLNNNYRFMFNPKQETTILHYKYKPISVV
jgi:hypothetical protein